MRSKQLLQCKMMQDVKPFRDVKGRRRERGRERGRKLISFRHIQRKVRIMTNLQSRVTRHNTRGKTTSSQSYKRFTTVNYDSKVVLNAIFQSQVRLWHFLSSGCGSVGKAVASDTRGPQIESGHRQIFTVNCIEKTKIKKKRPGKAHFSKDCGSF